MIFYFDANKSFSDGYLGMQSEPAGMCMKIQKTENDTGAFLPDILTVKPSMHGRIYMRAIR